MLCLRMIVIVLVALLSLDAALAQNGGERRLALVIGEGDYLSVPQLPNPPSDAEKIGAALRDVGFTQVTVVKNLSHVELLRALRDFAAATAEADWAVVYYAGHGIEVQGKNYMIPTDAELATDTDVDFEAVSMDAILASVARASKLRLVILDACRDNPFMRRMRRTLASRSLARGLARMDTPGDLFVVYSAQAGETALDGTDGESPFVKALLKNIQTPGLEINLLFRRVRADVLRATNSQQEPAFEGSLPGEELFFQKGPGPMVAPPTAAALAPPVAPARAVVQTMPPPSPAAVAAPAIAPTAAEKPKAPDAPKPVQTDSSRIATAVQSKAQPAVPSGPTAGLEPSTAPKPTAQADPHGRNIEIVKTDAPALPKLPSSPAAETSRIMTARLEDGRPPASVAAEADRRLLIVEVQAELRRLGCSSSAPDGAWSSAWKAALIQAAKRLGADVDDNDPSLRALTALRNQTNEICGAKASPAPASTTSERPLAKERRKTAEHPQRRPAAASHREAVVRVPQRREAPRQHVIREPVFHEPVVRERVVREPAYVARPVAEARPRSSRSPSNCFVFNGQRAC